MDPGGSGSGFGSGSATLLKSQATFSVCADIVECANAMHACAPGGGPRDVLHERLPQPHPLRHDVQEFSMWLLSGTLYPCRL